MEPAKKPAPPTLLLVQDFVNTTKLLYRQEEMIDPSVLREWLVRRGLIEAHEPVGAEDLRCGLEAREALRALMLANTDGTPNPSALEVFNRTLREGEVNLGLDQNRKPVIQSRGSGVLGALGEIAATALVGMIDGSWERLKVCANLNCQWSFYDRSANRSGTWCEMGICGSRAKMRAYRRRQQSHTHGARARRTQR